ncbi:NAD-dependent epimerase/dehydratase family protein [Tessaracoccus sp. OS52]|uniref:NAD-dependent epimerase/dehydratase family protein n=1 Tax=Tessaracoccus sp. OS52 TaxID=2886691 RepID=UPI001D108586|nr:NAD-dependent epimerase/dehydratase family protein [Tessaracoccus sp. OS52]MCC2592600.1 NAD-dependent epimerase/dehydratase family protein [Tessaracoccus sp. OS52]
MRVVVIGGSGHIGSFLIPRLVRSGHEVRNVSRGQRDSYVADAAWQDVRPVTVDRTQEEREGIFGERIAGLGADVVVDLICFTPQSAKALVEALRGVSGHLLHCGSIWRHGPSERLPVREHSQEPPLGDYGIAKAAIAELLREETRAGGLVTTSLHPGHIVGPGWHPVGPLGNFDPSVWRTLSAGRELAVPGLGAELMQHVHADDVAQAFEAAIDRRDEAAGEDFDVVAPSALNVRGYARTAAAWFGKEAKLRHVGWEEFRDLTSPEHADASWEHLVRSHYVSIDKARAVIGYAPRYEPEQAILESVSWLVRNGGIEIEAPLIGLAGEDTKA